MISWLAVNTKLKDWWGASGSKLLLALAFLLVALLSFEAGLLQQSLSVSPEPVIIRVADSACLPASLPPEGQLQGQATPISSGGESDTCHWVGSRNSNKYHHPASRCAKQIKPTNKRCFSTVEDAKAKGYLPGCLTP